MIRQIILPIIYPEGNTPKVRGHQGRNQYEGRMEIHMGVWLQLEYLRGALENRTLRAFGALLMI